MKILGLISSPSDPASRARIIQYKDPFQKQAVSLKTKYFAPLRDKDPSAWMHSLKKITGISEWRTANTIKNIARLPLLLQQSSFDLIWQNRLLLPHHFFFEKRFRKPLVFDYDDAIWLNEGEKQVAAAIAKAAVVFAGNEYLAEFGRQHNKNIYVIPTTVDTEKTFPLNNTPDKFTIGWVGSKSNLPYLHIVKPAIIDFLSLHKDARFIIVSSDKPSFFDFDNDRIIFKTWTETEENQLINSFSVGIMPLADDAYTRGKCSYKMLQYMACGKPVIVSPVGMNNKLLGESRIGMAATTTEEWLNAMIRFKNDAALSTTLGTNGRKLVEENYSVKKYAPIILKHFKEILGQ